MKEDIFTSKIKGEGRMRSKHNEVSKLRSNDTGKKERNNKAYKNVSQLMLKVNTSVTLQKTASPICPQVKKCNATY